MRRGSPAGKERRNEIKQETIPQTLFSELAEGEVERLNGTYSYPKDVVAVRGFEGFYMILSHYSEDEDNLEIKYGDIHNRETVFNWRVLELTQQWSETWMARR